MEENYDDVFTPVWATDDMNKVATKMFMDNKPIAENATTYLDLVTGNAKNDCIVPCMSTAITSVFLGEKHMNTIANQSTIDIVFDDKVTITTFYFPKFNIADFLSALGGSMGLWLGLGVVQTFEIIVRGGLKIAS